MGDKTYARWTGQIWFTDTFEFPPVWDFAEQIKNKKAAPREYMGERQTRIAYILGGLGKDFDVNSVREMLHRLSDWMQTVIGDCPSLAQDPRSR